MALMQHQDAYFPVLVKEARTTIALSAYTFSGAAECLGWCLRPAGKERMQQEKKKKPFSEVDNIKCVACAHLTFCDSKINQGSRSS